MKEQSEESQQEKKEEEGKEEEGKVEEELLAIDFVPLSDTPTAVPTPVEWADSISFTNYMSAIACNKEGVHEESMADIGEIDTKEGGHTEEEVLQSGLASLAQITKSFVDHIHYLSSKIIHSIKISYLDEEDLSREICFPCRANQIHGGKLEPLEDIQRLKQAVGSNHYIPAHRITELDGLNEVFEELLEDVRLSLYPHEPQISAKV